MRKLMSILLLLSLLVGCTTNDIEQQPETITETAVPTEIVDSDSEQDGSNEGVSAQDTDLETVADSINENTDTTEAAGVESEPDLTSEDAQEALSEALFEAIKQKEWDEVRQTIEDGVDVNRANQLGIVPLVVAGALKPANQEITEQLLEAGAEMSLQAFHMAVANPTTSPELIQLWIDHGADIHEPNPRNTMFTALIVAASQNNVEVGRVLLENGADIHALDGRGDPPISTSAFFGHLEFTEMLVEEGADFNMPGTSEAALTPLDFAINQGRDNVADYLRSIGAVSGQIDEAVDAIEADEVAATDTLTRTKISTTMLSENTGIEYPVDIFLPVDYDESAEPYPVIYATDGQWLSDRYDKVLFDAGVPAVLVSVHEGPEERRYVDFGFPGVNDYFPFFRDELMPMVEETYNVSPEHRTLVGQSAGGAQVWSFMLVQEVEDPLFDQFLIIDHGYWGDQDIEYKERTEARYATNPAMPGKLVLTTALLDWNRPMGESGTVVVNFSDQVDNQEQLFRDIGFEGLEITRFSYEVDHVNVPIPSFIDAVPIFFPDSMSDGESESEGEAEQSPEALSEALFEAIKQKEWDAVRQTVEGGVDLNLTNQLGMVPLSIVLHLEEIDMVQLFLENGATLSQADFHSALALYPKISVDMIDEMIAMGADIHSENERANDHSSLMDVANEGNVEAGQLLLDWGVDVDHRDRFGNVAIDLAIIRGHLPFVQLLVANDATIDDDLFQFSNSDEIDEYLLSLGLTDE